jgi:hypothetical protein
MNPKLEIRRANNEPKCASCGWWHGGTEPAGICGRHSVMASSGESRTVVTLDLAVCTDWRDGDPVQEVLPPESQE